MIFSTVNRYVHDIADDVREIHTIVNENGKRLLSLDCLSQEHYEHAKQWHADTEVEIRAAQNVALSIRDDIKTTKTGTELFYHKQDIGFYLK